MTNQEAYETMREYFARQGDQPAKAAEGVACRYRTADGKCCAIGCLIPPALYQPGFEGTGARQILSGDFVNTYGERINSTAVAEYFEGVDVNVMAELQWAHDRLMEDATGTEIVAALDQAARSQGLVAVPDYEAAVETMEEAAKAIDLISQRMETVSNAQSARIFGDIAEKLSVL